MNKFIYNFNSMLLRKAGAICAITLTTLMLLFPTLGRTNVLAYDPTDEITSYEIEITPLQDGSLEMDYHIEWLILDSDSLGPLEWVEIGIPNTHTLSYESLSDSIESIDVSGCYAYIYFTRKYYEGETVSFDFRIVQDYMYGMNYFTEGYTLYEFTPGWFDEIAIDKLTISWSNSRGLATEWTPAAIIKDDNIVWETSLPAGCLYTINVTYPNDAYAFDTSKTLTKGYDSDYYDDSDYSYYTGDDYYYYSDSDGAGEAFLGILVFLAIIFFILRGVIRACKSYSSGANLGTDYDVKITRTKIVYYEECPGCGAPREEGKDVCQYCGRSMIKSEELIKEENIPKEEKEAMSHTTAGTYRYVSSPSTYVRVNVVRTPRPSSAGSHSSGSSGRPSGRSSSCVHSSCACACASSCACACACACAGGGRAGCSSKDFYNTNLKLKQLKLKKR